MAAGVEDTGAKSDRLPRFVRSARRLRKGGNERRPSNGLRFSQPNPALV
jgi:hypothetical protein